MEATKCVLKCVHNVSSLSLPVFLFLSSLLQYAHFFSSVRRFDSRLPWVKLGNVDGRLEAHLAMLSPILQIPQNRFPALAGRQQVAPAARPAQRRYAARVAPQLARDTHGIEVPDDNGAIDTARGEIVAFAVEAQTGGMAGADRVGDVFGVVLQQVVLGEEKIHRGVRWVVVVVRPSGRERWWAATKMQSTTMKLEQLQI